MPLAIFGNVFQIESPRQSEIELDSRKLPLRPSASSSFTSIFGP